MTKVIAQSVLSIIDMFVFIVYRRARRLVIVRFVVTLDGHDIVFRGGGPWGSNGIDIALCHRLTVDLILLKRWLLFGWH